MLNISDYDIQAQFLEFLRSNNCEPAEPLTIKLDGQIHRFKVVGDKHGEKSGAYCVFYEGWPAGWCQNWRMGEAVSWCFNRDSLSDNDKRSLSDADYQKLLETSKLSQKKLKAKQEQDAVIAQEKARILFETLIFLNKDDSHTYLTKKQIYPYGLRLQKDTNNLAVPLYNIDGRIVNIQWISPDGDKWFFPKAPVSGNFFPVALALDYLKDDEPILIGEGVATMSTVYELTNRTCIAAMNCGNIPKVAELIQKKYPHNPIIIIADNDHKNTKNSGKEKAEEAVNKLKLNGLIIPEFSDTQDGTDWNDFYNLHGEEKTMQTLNSQIDYLKKITSLAQSLNPENKIPVLITIGNLFPCGFLSAIVAPPGTGKTMFIQKFVSDLSIGGDIFNGFATEENPVKSLIFAGEAGYEIMIRRAAQMKWPVNPANVIIIDQHRFESADMSVMLDDEEGCANIKSAIDIFKPQIVFFDSLVSFHEKDENKAVDMKPIFKKLSRKRTAKERSLNLNQDDVIGSSVFNRLVALIIAIEPMKDDEKTLLVRPLKSWFKAFMPFTYKITEDFYENPVFEIDLAPASVSNAKIAVWNYLINAFEKGEWFSSSQIILSEIEGNITDRQLRHILASFVDNGKLNRRGSKKSLEYSLI